ncbi:bifunctional PIG-L family deacetylase/class I SAM-dependent methyltransferase [Herbiconiux sp.]|uniref:bifunctional PIG-L family deacetylase/class I SAM-dependent methyltransferase n=1 Tax=Herbiconiux sp. TaxID=1871186 RepID=UPI0025C738C0|nr:bifunctional PIG-L family deacetylase/class I SAM-dependent methyltransferase [Herbiconiux sp.]
MSFTHDTVGTPEAAWLGAIERHDPVELQEGMFAEIDHLVLVAAHPDDETLGAAGLLARAYAAGVRTTVLVATSGEASHPDSSTHRPDELARLREIETEKAVALMAPGATVEFARLPDGGLSGAVPAMRERLEALVGVAGEGDPGTRGARVLLVSTWAGDRHPDHEAACEATAAVAESRELWHLAYPVWLWHWAAVDDPAVPWDSFVSVSLDPEIVDAKLHALALHTSQVSPLSGLPGDEVLLHEGMLEHFTRSFELFVDLTPSPPAPAPSSTPATAPSSTPADLTTAPAELHDSGVAADYFDRLHAGADDPWGFESRWYEERKRALLVAALPDRRYGTVLEVGCSTGVLSAALLERTTERFVGVDVSEVALEHARTRAAAASAPSPTAPSPTAEFRRLQVPAEWPEGPFDLVVVSEVGYYLDAPDLVGLLDRILDTLTPGGAVAVCHWRHPVAGRTATGDDVHAAFAAHPGLDRLAHHLEEDFVLDVFTRAPAVSIARREGIL